MKNLYKLIVDQNEQRIKYLQRPIYYGREIKKITKDYLPDARILIFGSAASGNYRPDSDFDILIITNNFFPNIFEQSKIKLSILERFPNNPFEIHLATPSQFKNWYKGFIKKNYLEV